MKSISYLFYVILSSVIGFILIPILTNFLTVEQMGKYALVNGALQLSLIIPNYSITMTVIKYFPKYENDIINFQKFIIRNGKKYIISLAIILNIGVFAYNYLKPTFVLNDNLIITLLLAIMMIYRIILSFIQNSKTPIYYAKVASGELLIRIIFTVIFLYFNLNYFSPFIAILISSSIVSLYSLKTHYIFNQKPKAEQKQAVDIDVSKINKFSKPLIISAVYMWILSTSDQYLINFFKDKSAAGIYMTGYVIPFQIITIFTTALMLELEPIASHLYESNNIDKLKSVYSKYIINTLYLDIPIIIFGSVYASRIFEVIYAKDFIEGYKLFVFIATASFFWSMYKVFYQHLIVMEKTKYISNILLASAVLNIGLNILLINKVGIIGAAISTLSSYIFLSILALVKTYKYIKIKIPWIEVVKLFFIIILLLSIDQLILNKMENNTIMLLIKAISLALIFLVTSIVLKAHKNIPYIDKLSIKLSKQTNKTN